MAKTKHKLDVERMAQIVWDMHQRMNALEASMFDFAIRERALEELMIQRKLMQPDAFNATCQRMIDEIKEMQADAANPVGRGPSDDAAAGDPESERGLVESAPGLGSGDHADPVPV